MQPSPVRTIATAAVLRVATTCRAGRAIGTARAVDARLSCRTTTDMVQQISTITISVNGGIVCKSSQHGNCATVRGYVQQPEWRCRRVSHCVNDLAVSSPGSQPTVLRHERCKHMQLAIVATNDGSAPRRLVCRFEASGARCGQQIQNTAPHATPFSVTVAASRGRITDAVQ